MNNSHRYSIHDRLISVEFTNSMAHIHNDDSFEDLMNFRARSGIRELVVQMKNDYEIEFGQPLEVTQKSFELEIWGHYYFQKFLIKIRHVLIKIGLKSIKQRLLNSTQVFDCGEHPIDRNRWFWNGISFLYPLFTMWIKDKS